MSRVNSLARLTPSGVGFAAIAEVLAQAGWRAYWRIARAGLGTFLTGETG